MMAILVSLQLNSLFRNRIAIGGAWALDAKAKLRRKIIAPQKTPNMTFSKACNFVKKLIFLSKILGLDN